MLIFQFLMNWYIKQTYFFYNILVVGENNHSVYPSAMKLALRYHIQKICQSTLCADTLVIHLNSPTTKDGTMLLWDVDGNGEVS